MAGPFPWQTEETLREIRARAVGEPVPEPKAKPKAAAPAPEPKPQPAAAEDDLRRPEARERLKEALLRVSLQGLQPELPTDVRDLIKQGWSGIRVVDVEGKPVGTMADFRFEAQGPPASGQGSAPQAETGPSMTDYFFPTAKQLIPKLGPKAFEEGGLIGGLTTHGQVPNMVLREQAEGFARDYAKGQDILSEFWRGTVAPPLVGTLLGPEARERTEKRFDDYMKKQLAKKGE